ncbi:MAG: cation transporter, partial [Parvularculaceae bacterium]
MSTTRGAHGVFATAAFSFVACLAMTQAPRKSKTPDEATGNSTALAADARATASHCEHCGDPLAGLKVVRRRIGASEQSFCCLGCAFIAEQLYLARATSRDLAALDAALGGARRAAEPPVAGALKREQIEVHGMVCAACALLIEHRLRHEPGVVSAHVDFGARRAYVAFDPQRSSPAALRRAVEASGYRTSSSAQAERKA